MPGYFVVGWLFAKQNQQGDASSIDFVELAKTNAMRVAIFVAKSAYQPAARKMGRMMHFYETT